MRRRVLRIVRGVIFPCCVSFFICIGCHQLRQPPIAPASGGELFVETLANGMTLLIKENPGSRTVSIDAWLNAGSLQEPPQWNGISHFLEHMLFKGTQRYGPGEIDRTIENVGGVWNAGTAHDFMHLYLSLAAPFWQLGTDVIADVVMNSRLDAGELERERQVILEEYRRKQDNPEDFLWEEVYERSFVHSPYRLPILGTPETIKEIDQETMQAYYQRLYAPANMLLCVVGDIEKEEVAEYCRRCFGEFSRPHRPFLTDELETEYARFKTEYAQFKTEYAEGILETYQREVNDTYLAISFPAPSMNEPHQVLAVDLLTVVLGEGRSSRLYRRLKEELQLVSTIDVSYPTQRLPGLIVISATLSYEKLIKTQSAIIKELEKLKAEPIEERELQKAKRQLENAFYFSLETNAGQASIIGYYYCLNGNLDFFNSYLENLRLLTAEDVMEAARSYLQSPAMNIFVLKPKEATLP